MAGAIGLAALALAVLAGDGDDDFPGVALERQLMAHARSAPAPDSGRGSAGPSAADHIAPGRLVEDPALDPPRLAEAAATPTGDPGEPRVRPVAGAEGESAGAQAVQSLVAPPPAERVAVLARESETGAPAPPAASEARASSPNVAADVAIQLIAVGRRDQAVQAWTNLRRAHEGLLGDLQPIVVDPDRRRSTYFRLRAGPFASAAAARARCAALVQRRVECIVVRHGG